MNFVFRSRLHRHKHRHSNKNLYANTLNKKNPHRLVVFVFILALHQFLTVDRGKHYSATNREHVIDKYTICHR